jgi:acyl-CoA synthetase (AMP-forming)/AMP-acid ligase II
VDVPIVETETMKPLGEGSVGEIWIPSKSSKAAGYCNKDKETKEDFHAKLAGVDGRKECLHRLGA